MKHVATVLLLAALSTAQNAPTYCKANVIESMKTIRHETGNGTYGIEASFSLQGTPENYTVYYEPMTREQNSQSIIIFKDTFAVFHVHPNRGGFMPSTPYNNYLGNGAGDTGMADAHKLDIYVVSSRALSVYYWKTKTMEIVRSGTSWSTDKKCQ